MQRTISMFGRLIMQCSFVVVLSERLQGLHWWGTVAMHGANTTATAKTVDTAGLLAKHSTPTAFGV
jgi:hypothetical protein